MFRSQRYIARLTRVVIFPNYAVSEFIYIYIRYSVLISELSKLSRGYAQLFSDSLFYIDCVNDTLNRRSVTAKLPLITMRIEKEESIESFLSNF